MATEQTRARILETAERMFAQRGFEATSVRALTKDADVNLAAVHYHFGSKEGLIEAVLRRRIEPMADERMRGFHMLAAQDQIEVRDVIRAFVEPAVRLSRDRSGGQHLMPMLVRTYTEPNQHVQDVLEESAAPQFEQLFGLLQRCLPQLSHEDLSWRVHFLIGAMAHAMADVRWITQISKGACDPYDPEAILEHLIPFLEAALTQQQTGVPANSY
jgi:AcrR family transcriptional regulator